MTKKKGTFRLVATSFGAAEGAFHILGKEIKEAEIPAGMEVPQPPPPKMILEPVKKIPMFSGCAIAADSRSAWVAFPGGKLQKFSLPELDVLGTYDVAKNVYRLAIDKRGMLYAMAEHKPEKDRFYPWDKFGPGELHFYDTNAVPKKIGEQWRPAKVVPIDATVRDWCLAPAQDRLYFLDLKRNKLGRIDVNAAKEDGEVADIDPPLSAMCLTPNGKTLYACSIQNVLLVIDAHSLKITRSIKFDVGSPRAIQANDKGLVFLSGDPEGHVYLLDVNRAGKEVKAILWARTLQNSCIRLDQDRLFAHSRSVRAFHLWPRPTLHKGGEMMGPYDFDRGERQSMELSPNGRFLFSELGVIFKID